MTAGPSFDRGSATPFHEGSSTLQVRAVLKKGFGYLRVSTERQETSLAEQKNSIVRWARENGYEIVEWFIDEDISGMEFDHRPDFQRMIQKCETDRSVDAVILWMLSRFARPEEAMEAASYMWAIRKTGKVIWTVSNNQCLDGTFSSFLMAMLQSEQDGKFVKDLSANITRHQIENALKGYSTGRKPAFGLDLLVGPPGGPPRYRVRFISCGLKRKWRRQLLDPITLAVIQAFGPEEDFEKSKTDRSTFVAGDPAHVAIVVRIFNLAAEGRGLCKIARALNAEAAPSPCGLGWRMTTVRDILRNWIFRGVLVTGRFAEGRLNYQRGDRIERRTDVRKGKRGRPVPITKPESEWNRKEGALEPLIPLDLWDRAHAMIKAKGFPRTNGKGLEEGRTPGRSAESAHLLTGLVFCSCGAPMYAWPTRRTKDGKVYLYRTYLCSAYQADDVTKKCDHRQIDADALEGYVLDCVKTDYGLGKSELRAALIMRLKAERAPGTKPVDTGATDSRIAALRVEIADGVRNMMKEPEDFIREQMRDEVRRLRGEQTALEKDRERRVSEARVETSAPDVEAEAERLLGHLDEIRRAFADGPVGVRNRFMRRYAVRIELEFTTEKKGKRTFSRFLRGVLDTRDVTGVLPERPNSGGVPQGVAVAVSAELSGLVGRANWIRTSDLLHPMQAL